MFLAFLLLAIGGVACCAVLPFSAKPVPHWPKMSAVGRVVLAVGSKNPVKVNAAKQGAQQALQLEDVSVHGYDVPSGVSAQPMSDDETLQGAITRAKNAFEAHTKEHGHPPTYALGLEGGIASHAKFGEDLECFAWMVVYNGSRFGRARTGSFQLPPAIRKLVVEQGMELGAADDHLFGTINSKQSGGSVGQFTRGVIDRTRYYEHAVVLAFVPFLWNSLYET